MIQNKLIMRVRTTVTLPKDLLIRVDALAGKKHKRSEIVESALRDFLQKKARTVRDKRELEIINANADKLNEEALDVLEYQQVNW
jgi:metal-responsive CopG/Arc/MetJ family transcriptional regulator